MKSVKQPRTTARVELFYARSGPKRGQPDCEVVFATKAEAVAFLANLHGLSIDESRLLSKELALPLKPKWHGAERCAIDAVSMSPAKAKKELASG